MQDFSNKAVGILGKLGTRGDSSPTGSGKGAIYEEMLDGFLGNLAVWTTRRTNYATFLQIIRGEDFFF